MFMDVLMTMTEALFNDVHFHAANTQESIPWKDLLVPVFRPLM
jgi:hypothetical protein